MTFLQRVSVLSIQTSQKKVHNLQQIDFMTSYNQKPQKQDIETLTFHGNYKPFSPRKARQCTLNTLLLGFCKTKDTTQRFHDQIKGRMQKGPICFFTQQHFKHFHLCCYGREKTLETWQTKPGCLLYVYDQDRLSNKVSLSLIPRKLCGAISLACL